MPPSARANLNAYERLYDSMLASQRCLVKTSRTRVTLSFETNANQTKGNP